jgi:hypothetical protein
MSQKLFEAKKAVEEQFKKDVNGNSNVTKYYYYYAGEVLESQNLPVLDTSGFKFRCTCESGNVRIVNID